MIADTEYVIRKSDEFRGIPYSMLHFGIECFTGKPRAIYETDEYEILSKVEYGKKIDAFCEEFCGRWKEITEQRYDEMLNVLPPLKRERGGFFISEAYTLNIHPFYQKYQSRYYEAMFQLNTPREKILSSIEEYVNSN